MEFIKEYPIEKLKVWEMNPRKNDEASEKLSGMIQEYGFVNPIIIDQHGVIRAGHTRLKAAKKLDKKTVPVLIHNFENEAQAIGFAIADNKSSEWAEWDFGRLEELMKELEEQDFDIEMTGFDDLDAGTTIQDGLNENGYTDKIKIPQYEIKDEDVELQDLIKDDKANELINEIEKSEISDLDKEFLIKAAYRHQVFNYHNIAEYYAKANKPMQKLMEKSALVIIDFDDAIANGYTTLKNEILKMRDEDEE